MIIIPRPSMLSRSWNLEYDRSTAPIIDRIQWACQRFECEVDLRGIATLNKKEGTHEWTYVRAVVGPKTSDPVVHKPLEYPQVRFEHEIISVASFLQRFGKIRDDETKKQSMGRFQIGALTADLLTNQNGWDTASRTAGDRMCSYPHWSATCNLISYSSQADILVSSKADHPLYGSLSRLRADVGGFVVDQADDGRFQKYSIFVIDQRGWFGDLQTTPDGLVASIGGMGLNDLIIQARINGRAWSAAAAESVPLPELELPATIQMALVQSNDELMDWQVWDVYPLADESELRVLIGAGENEQVEFKPWVAFGDSKFGEIADAVIAMANGDAQGVIIIGIDDYGQPADWKSMKDFEAAARTEGRKFPDQLSMRKAAAECYVAKLLDRLADRVSPLPPIQRDILEYEGSVVLRLQILPAPIMITRAGLHHVLVRRGASNRHASPDVLSKLVHRGR